MSSEIEIQVHQQLLLLQFLHFFVQLLHSVLLPFAFPDRLLVQVSTNKKKGFWLLGSQFFVP